MMLRSKRLRNEDGANPGSPAHNSRASTLVAQAMQTPTPMKRAKRAAYEVGEHKDLIDVFLRVRPTVEGQRDMVLGSSPTSIVLPTKDRAEQTTFSFNEVFTEEASQEKVFERVAQPLLNDFLDSERNCFLFAYGNSNAGKTYTIYGNEEEPGILPRVMRQVLERTGSLLQKKQAFLLVSFVEVYGESFYDLLNQREKLRLKEAPNGVYFSGATESPVTSIESALKLVEHGQKNRQVADTQLNHDSSRSHSLFTIKLVRINPGFTLEMVRNRVPDCTRLSHFCITDLAGSERAKRTQNTGTRLKEAGHINGALMTFRKCVEAVLAIQRGATNIVPYRESKLTQAVRDFFIGQAKGRMIINISSAEEDFEETLHVLDFANIAKEVSTNIRRAERRPGVPATPYAARPSTISALSTDNSAELGDARAAIEELNRRLTDLQQRLIDKDVEMVNKEMEVREECATVMAKRLQEMEVMNRESVERARAFAEDKYERKIQILSQFIQFQAAPAQQQPTKTSLEELAIQMDAEHWKRQCKEVELAAEAKDRTIKSLQIQLRDMESVRSFNKELTAQNKKLTAEVAKLRDAQIAPKSPQPGHSTPKRTSPIPKIVITPPKEDISSSSDLDCHESLSDDDNTASNANAKRGTVAKKNAASHDSPYAASTKPTRKRKANTSDDEEESNLSEDEQPHKSRKAAAIKKSNTKVKTASKKAGVSKAPLTKKSRTSDESSSGSEGDDMPEEEERKDRKQRGGVLRQKTKPLKNSHKREKSGSEQDDDSNGEEDEQPTRTQRGGTLRQKTKTAGNFFRDCFTPEKLKKKKLLGSSDSPFKHMDESFDKENSPVKVVEKKTAVTKGKRTLARRVKAPF